MRRPHVQPFLRYRPSQDQMPPSPPILITFGSTPVTCYVKLSEYPLPSSVPDVLYSYFVGPEILWSGT